MNENPLENVKGALDAFNIETYDVATLQKISKGGNDAVMGVVSIPADGVKVKDKAVAMQVLAGLQSYTVAEPGKPQTLVFIVQKATRKPRTPKDGAAPKAAKSGKK